jgi:hypothetical protein
MLFYEIIKVRVEILSITMMYYLCDVIVSVFDVNEWITPMHNPLE